MRFSTTLALGATLTLATAQQNYLGFNAGATTDKGTPKTQEDFEREFKAAKALKGAPGDFNVFRLYSNVQAGSQTPIAAFPAAIATKTKLLLGIWASGTQSIDVELDALMQAVEEHGEKLTSLVVGLSVGSEDMYRVSEPGIKNKSDVGQEASVLVKFIREARKRLANTPLKGVKIGHVDTWTAWVNGTNKAVIDEVDWLGVNAFPFYQSEVDNKIGNGENLLSDALQATEGVASGKDVWLTETGWPYSGPESGAAEATLDNAERFWKTAGCDNFGKRNVFWYTLRDANPANEVKFAVTSDLSSTPRYDLSCPARNQTDDDTPSASKTGSGSKPTGGAGSGNGTSSGNDTDSGSGSGGNGTSSDDTSSPTGSASPEQNTGAASSLTISGSMVLSALFAAAAWIV